MSTPRLRLREEVRLHLEYEDHTPFGGALSGRADSNVRRLAAPIVELWGRVPLGEIVRRAPALLEAARREGLGQLFVGAQRLDERFLYPDPTRVRLEALLVEGPGREERRIALPAGITPELSAWLGEWQSPSAPPSSAAARELFAALAAAGAFTAQPPPEVDPLAGVRFVGHATLLFAAEGRRLLFDPFLLPATGAEGYQPMGAAALGPLDAVFITHSHPDHFDLGTLLRLGRDVPIHVPRVARESTLTIDMQARLTELGFRRVSALDWWEEVAIGPLSVRALPFYGEQPTNREVLHPEVTNHGNTYLVEHGGKRYALGVDSGRDRRGDLVAVAAEARRRYGPVDVLFGGYRAFAKYPVHYLFSSIPRYLPFVPASEWGVRQKLMNDADDLLDAAERWGAARLVPYADGGAPWYWERGLGPALDDPALVLRHPRVDPPPEVVVRAAQERSSSLQEGQVPSPVRVHVLRPGDLLRFDGERLQRCRSRPHAWPYDQPSGRNSASVTA